MENPTLEELRRKVQHARSQKASLQADLIRMQDAPTADEVLASKMAASHPLPDSIVQLSKQVAEAEERCILHRCSAWTVFELDLDVGRREREQRSREAAGRTLEKISLGLGVRLETYHKGRFYEPYYLVFAKPSQLVSKDLTKVTDAALDVQVLDGRRTTDPDDSEDPSLQSKDQVRLIRHTVPTSIPLQTLLADHLGPGRSVDGATRGGFDLLDGLLGRDGLFAFLSRLHSYLMAYVIRKAQAIALRKLPLPSRSDFEAFSNDSFDRMSVVWDIPDVTEGHVMRYEEEMGIDRSYIVNDPALANRLRARRNALKARKKLYEQELGGRKLIKAVHMTINVHDPLAISIGPIRGQDEGDRQDCLTCTSGSVKVEIVRHLSNNFKLGKRRRMADATSIELEYTRRVDLERQFAESDVNIERAVRHAIEVVWREEVRAASEYEHDFRELSGVPLSERMTAQFGRVATESPSLLASDTMDTVG